MEKRAGLRTYEYLEGLRVSWRNPLNYLELQLSSRPCKRLRPFWTPQTSCPSALNLATVFSITRRIGGCGLITPSHLITPKHSPDVLARRRTSACSSRRHGSGITIGSHSHGFEPRSVSIMSCRSEGECAIGPTTDTMMFCPSICKKSGLAERETLHDG